MARLIKLFDRLEAATSRLEDMATSVDASHPETIAAINKAHSSQEVVAPTIAEPQVVAEPLPRSIEDFGKIIDEDVQAFVATSEKLGGLVEEQVYIHMFNFTDLSSQPG